MDPLSTAAVRVLGSLIEKEITTPDNYPLTLNALTAACNQSSNRDPVLELDEATVLQSLDELGQRSLARAVQRSDSRVRRYRHLVAESLHLHDAEIAALCILMLRGAQTAGEIRTRSARLFEFPDIARVELALESLMTLSPPLVGRLPKRRGLKEVRYAHLLSGEHVAEPPDPGPVVDTPVEQGRVDVLEEAVVSLRTELAELRAEFDEFRRQFQ
jgi:uncharacterized protein